MRDISVLLLKSVANTLSKGTTPTRWRIHTKCVHVMRETISNNGRVPGWTPAVGVPTAGDPTGWSAPNFGEDNPLLPQIPTRYTPDGQRITIPAHVACYPLLKIDPVKDDAWETVVGRRHLALNCYMEWRNALRAYVAFFSQFYKGDQGFDNAPAPSDRELLQRLEDLWENNYLGPALKPNVFRAAIAICAKACGRDAVTPTDLIAVDCDVSFAKHGSGAAARCGAIEEAGGCTSTGLDDVYPTF